MMINPNRRRLTMTADSDKPALSPNYIKNRPRSGSGFQPQRHKGHKDLGVEMETQVARGEE